MKLKMSVIAAVAISLLVAMLLPRSAAATDKLDAAILSDAEIPAECRAIEGRYPMDIQTQILFERYEAYRQTLPPLAGKQAQSLRCGRQEGTIYYFEFADAASRQRAEVYIRGLLWGADRPSPGHPEEIEHGDSLLAVVSFEKAPASLLEAIRAKLSGGAKPVASSGGADSASTRAALGDWRGTSLCLVKPSACHDEEALYHVRADKSGKLQVEADKIVDGKPVNMGAIDCSYDAAKKLLHCEWEFGVLDLALQGDRLEGSMFLPDKTRWREIKLKKLKP
ncbi:MAG: hypothetical protein LAO20_01920 [Acidobacteriia bacterium]|nr:hypothetical protein [Terriglobia bacterium]